MGFMEVGGGFVFGGVLIVNSVSMPAEASAPSQDSAPFLGYRVRRADGEGTRGSRHSVNGMARVFYFLGPPLRGDGWRVGKRVSALDPRDRGCRGEEQGAVLGAGWELGGFAVGPVLEIG